MAYSNFGSSDWMTPVAGFNPSDAGTKAFGDIGSKKADTLSSFGTQALGNISAIEQADIAAKAQVEAATRAAQWSALGDIGGSLITGGASLIPKTLKIV